VVAGADAEETGQETGEELSTGNAATEKLLNERQSTVGDALKNKDGPTETTLQQQILREAENLYGSGKKELLEAFKDVG